MIYRLQRKFILICTASVLAVVTLMFGVILAWNISSMNRNMDMLADRVSEGGGRFPGILDEGIRPDKKPPRNEPGFDFITPETPFSTRHFTVFFDKNGEVAQTFTESIYAIDEDTAIEYAEKAMADGDERGWISSYRYKIFSTDLGMGVVFVDGSMSRSAMMQSMTIAGIVLVGCAALVLVLIFLFSRRAVRPIAESYQKQKQFITDAGHELKTPLTLILANLDIAEAELGSNEWLDDIRSEGHRMTELVGQLVALSRMDEEGDAMHSSMLPLGAIVGDIVSEFKSLAKSKGLTFQASIDEGVTYLGDEALLRRLVGVLMDNAVKYCDNGGEISVTLSGGKHLVMTVENSYSAVEQIELHRLFDRFYRADPARTFSGGYGIGLSMAKAIVEKHKGEITAYKKDSTHIGFKIVL
ncbi:MAG: HAMP domain-containing histidine kinase [Ruminococcaceae bacterium]|nr:HAMP domain-containing histidine kinase [Oscillospiraceae bacterium]